MSDKVVDLQTGKAISIAKKCKEMLAKEQKPIGVVAKYLPEDKNTVIEHIQWTAEPLVKLANDCHRIAYKSINPDMKAGERLLSMESIRGLCIDAVYDYNKLLDIKRTDGEDQTQAEQIKVLKASLQDALIALNISEVLAAQNNLELPKAITASKKTIQYALGKNARLAKQVMGGE